MTESEILERLTKVFRSVFEDEALVARMDMKASDVERWDSLSHVDMILVVEEEFGIRMSARELAGLNNVGDLVHMVSAKIS